ncbi:MAG: hypothetical protein V2I34_04660 [Bacteroidales bacterium]|jgi:hypothetical protein|nr:hypothetical protein [Bacteroidales bacterium]
MITDIIDDNVDRIRKDIINRGLTYESLLDDIVDHVCCLVEEEMETGCSFEQSYNAALNSIGDKRLPEIQHQTLLLLDKKFQKMKKLTYFLGLAAVIIILIGAISKHMHWPGAGIELTLGLLIIILGFLPLYFTVSYREQTEKKSIIYPLVAYLTIAVLLAAAVFRIQHWPAARTVTNIGLIILIIGFVPLYVVNAFQKARKGKLNLAYIIMLLVGVAIVTLMFNVRFGKEALETYRSEAILNESRIFETEQRTKLIIDNATEQDHIALDKIQEIHNEAEMLQQMIDEMLAELLASIDQEGASLEELRRMDYEGAGRDVILKSGWAGDFISSAREFESNLYGVVEDPLSRYQIQDHLEFTGRIWFIEFGPEEVRYDPVIKIYYKHTDVSKGIALAEYVAISSLMEKE